jgi:RimJ/RimL family protein N-acetyltransferase
MKRPKRREGVEGTRIRLSPIRAKDAPALFRWINDRALVVFNAGFHPVHASQHAAWMRSVAGRPDLVVFAIRRKRGDALIGVCQLHSISAVHRSAELQIRIGEAASRGRGYGVEAVRLLLEFAFRDLNLHRVWLRVFGTNRRALKTYAAAGFAREGLMRDAAFIDGRYVDVVIMGVTRRD